MRTRTRTTDPPTPYRKGTRALSAETKRREANERVQAKKVLDKVIALVGRLDYDARHDVLEALRFFGGG